MSLCESSRFVRSQSNLRLLAVVFAACFTLFSSAAFAQFGAPTQLTLLNGWTDAGFATSHAMVEEENGIVHLRGSIETTGTNPLAFVLPVGYRPSDAVFIPVDLCNGANGRLIIDTAGDATVQAENSFSDASCFTSLDGASFSVNASGYTALTLVNGWANYSTRSPAVKLVGANVRFEGAIFTGGTTPTAFNLPVGFRPPADVYINVDLCNATKGRLHITSAGDAEVQVETAFSNAQCFTSLDGAWFAFGSGTNFQNLALVNGWTGGPFGSSKPQAEQTYGVVYLRGAIGTTGASNLPTTLAARFRPVTNVYVPVDLCNATKGRVLIQTSGAVTVSAEGGTFPNAQCFTSLDGISFVQ